MLLYSYALMLLCSYTLMLQSFLRLNSVSPTGGWSVSCTELQCYLRLTCRHLYLVGSCGWRTNYFDTEEKGPHLILVGKLGKFKHIRKNHQANQENFQQIRKIFGKLGKFLANQENVCQIRKVLVKLGKFSKKIRKTGKFGKWGKLIRKNNPQYEESLG